MAAPVTITFLGGLGQIGRNCAAIEMEGRIVVLDCGQMFGGDDLPGVDAVLPDLSYLIENADRVDAVGGGAGAAVPPRVARHPAELPLPGGRS